MTQSNRPTRCPHPVNNQRQDPAEDLPVQGSALRLGVRDSQRWEIQKSAFRRGKPPQPDALAPDDRVARLPGPVRRTRACGAAGTAPTHPRGLDAGAVAVLVGGGSGSIVPGPVPGKGMGSARVAAFQVLYSYVLRQALQRPRAGRLPGRTRPTGFGTAFSNTSPRGRALWAGVPRPAGVTLIWFGSPCAGCRLVTPRGFSAYVAG